MGTLGKKERPQVPDFLMAVDYAVGHGPIHSFNRIRFREKVGWVGPAHRDGATYIDKHELFGGDDGGEGGVSGTVEFYRGTWVQKMSAALARRFGLTPDTAPGYRGIGHVFFHGNRPPGGSMIERFTDTTQHQSWSGSTPEGGTSFSTILVDDPEQIENGDFWRESIDAELVTFRLFWRVEHSTGAGVFSSGAVANFYNADGNQLGHLGSSHVPWIGEEDEPYSNVIIEGVVPAGTREIRYRTGSTRAITEAITDVAELEANAGVLTNFFGDNFEFSDIDTGGTRGFRWSTNNPYYQPPDISVTVAPQGLEDFDYVEPFIWPITGVSDAGVYERGTWDSAFEREARTLKSNLFSRLGNTVRDHILGPGHTRNERFTNVAVDVSHLPDANPAVVIYECMTNGDWGKGEPTAAMDALSYARAAKTLQDEMFGLSLRWNGQDTIDSFVSEILDHIKAVHYQHPTTGLWTLKLLRGDYELDDCLVLNVSNCKITSSKVRGWGETVNQVTVEYTCPASEETETVDAQNAANIAIQGGIVPETRGYHAIRNPWLAQIVADRDVMEASAVLTTVEGTVPRGVDIEPGDVVRIIWPRDGIDGYFRLNEFDPGSTDSKHISFKAVTDVFSVTTLDRVVDPDTAPVDPETVAPEEIDTTVIMSAPYFALGDEAPNYAAPFNRLVMTATDTTRDYSEIKVQTVLTSATGGDSAGIVRRITPPDIATLGTTLAPEETSTIPAANVEIALGLNPSAGAILMIGTSEAAHEIVMLDSFDLLTDEWTVIRGCYDTIPRAWASDDLIWNGAFIRGPLVQGTYSEDDEVDFYFLSATINATLDALDIDPVTHVVQERINAPIRPANCSIDGNGFSDTAYAAGAVPATIPITWANRNRTAETGVIPRWGDGNVTPEVGQTTTLRFYGGGDDTFNDADFTDLEFSATGLSGTSYDLDPANLESYRFYLVEFVSVRDGIESIAGIRLNLDAPQTGYGNNYGFDYGENDG